MMKLIAAALALLLCAPAFADQAPETPLVTGPNMQQTPASQILIKVPGSTIQTLGAALSAAGCTTNCTLSNPTITGGSFSGGAVAATTLSTTVGGNTAYVQPSAASVLQINNGTLGQVGSLGAGNINLTQLVNPVAPTVTTAGTAGGATDTYAIIAVLSDGTTSGLGVTTSLTTANATLNSTNYNTIAWTTVPGAYQYQVWRTAAGGAPNTTGLIATVASGITSYNDQGAAGSGATAQAYNSTAVISVNGVPAIQFGNAYRGTAFVPDPESMLVGVGAGGPVPLASTNVEIAALGWKSCGGGGAGLASFDTTCVGYFNFGSLVSGFNDTGVGNAVYGDSVSDSFLTGVGEDAGRHAAGSGNTIAIGTSSDYYTICQLCISIGDSALHGAAGSTANNVVVVSHGALSSSVLVAPSFMTLVGNALLNGSATVSPFNDVVIGDNIGASAVSPVGVTIIGHAAASGIINDSNLLVAGVFAGRHLAGSNATTVLGPNVGTTTCVNTQNVLLIGVNGSTDCGTANEQNRIHIGAGAGDIIFVTNTASPATSVSTFAGFVNAVSGYQANGTAGVTCSGTPTTSFASTNGIVTHC